MATLQISTACMLSHQCSFSLWRDRQICPKLNPTTWLPSSFRSQTCFFPRICRKIFIRILSSSWIGLWHWPHYQCWWCSGLASQISNPSSYQRYRQICHCCRTAHWYRRPSALTRELWYCPCWNHTRERGTGLQWVARRFRWSPCPKWGRLCPVPFSFALHWGSSCFLSAPREGRPLAARRSASHEGCRGWCTDPDTIRTFS